MIPSITSMKDAFSLEGKNAIVTGGNRGLGAAICECFAEVGANVVITCRDMAKAADEIEKIKAYGVKCTAISMDVTDIASVRAGIAAAADFYDGKIDILVNNAGVSYTGALLDEPEDLPHWHQVINTDLNGTVYATYEVAKRMKETGGGCMINVTSNAAFMVNHGQPMSWYSSAKAAANHFTHCMACELAPYDIRVNGIAPGFTNTELSKHIPPENIAVINKQAVAGRFGEPIEIGALAVYLASPASAQMTGHIAVIDGGYMLRC